MTVALDSGALMEEMRTLWEESAGDCLQRLRAEARIARLERIFYDGEPLALLREHGPTGRTPVGEAFFHAFFARSCPSVPAIEAVADWVGRQTVLEVEAGRGLWSRLLADRGVETLCADGEGAARRGWCPRLPLCAGRAIRTLAAEVLLVHTRAGCSVYERFSGGALLLAGPPVGEPTGWRRVESIPLPGWGEREELGFFVRRWR